jgi:hypothetical protein
MWRGGRVTRASSSLGSNLANNASARKNGNVVGVVAGVHFRRGKNEPRKSRIRGTALSKGLAFSPNAQTTCRIWVTYRVH